jgi:hypothetical protein
MRNISNLNHLQDNLIQLKNQCSNVDVLALLKESEDLVKAEIENALNEETIKSNTPTLEIKLNGRVMDLKHA